MAFLGEFGSVTNRLNDTEACEKVARDFGLGGGFHRLLCFTLPLTAG